MEINSEPGGNQRRFVSYSSCTQAGDPELPAAARGHPQPKPETQIMTWQSCLLKSAFVFNKDNFQCSHTPLSVLFSMGENTIFRLSAAKLGYNTKKRCAIKLAFLYQVVISTSAWWTDRKVLLLLLQSNLMENVLSNCNDFNDSQDLSHFLNRCINIWTN